MLLFSTLGVAVAATPATAHPGGPPAGCYAYDAPFGASCFEWAGDDHWVKDKLANDWSARVQIETTYGKVRWCANTHGAVSWHECTFDHQEGTCVRWRMFEQNGTGGPTRNWTNWSYWHSTSTGDIC
jgi:hypothetical protein